MTAEQAAQTNIGDEVEYEGRRYWVSSVKCGLIAGPHFRLIAQGPGDYHDEGLTSYVLLGKCKGYA